MDLLSLAEHLLEELLRTARKQGSTKIAHIHIEIGALSEATPEALRQCFQGILKNTPAEGAKLTMTEAKGSALCLACGNTQSLTDSYTACDECGSFDLKILEGEHVKIRHVQML